MLSVGVDFFNIDVLEDWESVLTSAAGVHSESVVYSILLFERRAGILFIDRSMS